MMPHIDLNNPMKRRISEGFAFFYLFGIEALIIAGIIYLILTYALTFLLGIFERKLKESD